MIYSAKFNHGSDGKFFAAGGTVSDKAGAKPSPTVKIFDTESGEVKLSEAVGSVSSVHFSPDGGRLAAGCGGGEIYQWAVDSLLA